MRSSIESPHNDAGLVTDILASLDIEATTVQFLTAGATSRVWRAQTRTDTVVIRVAAPATGKVARFDAEVGLRQRLYRIDGRVAEPLASGRWKPAMPGNGTDVAWCVDRFIAGETAPRCAIPDQVCHDLGELLSRLHALPVVRYGLLEDRRDRLIGQEPDLVAGLLTRLQDPWPFNLLPLQRHPIATAAPDLVGRLAPLEGTLRAVIAGREHCLSHTDLHEKQILIAGGHLAGLLDFGDAAIGPRAWDIASFAYFHGWHLAQVLLIGLHAQRVVASPPAHRSAQLRYRDRAASRQPLRVSAATATHAGCYPVPPAHAGNRGPRTELNPPSPPKACQHQARLPFPIVLCWQHYCTPHGTEFTQLHN
jgi:aminoglycoside phosphotransferase (APT) family kinase protein